MRRWTGNDERTADAAVGLGRLGLAPRTRRLLAAQRAAIRRRFRFRPTSICKQAARPSTHEAEGPSRCEPRRASPTSERQRAIHCAPTIRSDGPSNSFEAQLSYMMHSYMVTRLLDRTAIDSAKKGSADLLILALVDEQALHGYEIARRIDQRSDGTLQFTLASHTPRSTGWRSAGGFAGAGWSAGQRRRRYYRITDNGRSVLASQREEWARFIAALTQVAGIEPA